VIADHLSRNGIAVLRYDDRGVGGSSGDIMQSTSAEFADDALAAVALLRGRDDIAPDRIGLLGHSEGGLIAPIAASRSDDVAFLVLLAAPGVPSRDLMAKQTEYIIRASGAPEEVVSEHVEINRQLTAAATSDGDADEVRAEIRRLVLRQNELAPEGSRATGDALEQLLEASINQVFLPWYQYFLRYDPRETLEQVTVPVLALNGGLDLQVVDTQNLPAIKAALAAAGNDDVTTRSLPLLNHMFQHATTGALEEFGTIEETISQEVLDIITEWINARFARSNDG
jgi:pimeloyl-ACP methyl ester carboxylesterase